MQTIKSISKRCKDKFKRYMDNTLYDYDCMIQNKKNERFYKGISVWTKLKDKVSLATACFNKSISKIDINTGQPIYDTDKGDLRRKELNSKK